MVMDAYEMVKENKWLLKTNLIKVALEQELYIM